MTVMTNVTRATISRRREADWIILRCSPSSTIALAEALTDAGFTTWTPTAKTTRDAMRAKEGLDPLPRGKGSTEITQPIVSTFVFTARDRLSDLLRMADSPALNYRVWDKQERRMVVRGRPYFSVMRIDGAVPVIPDWQLDALRAFERQAAEKVSKKRRRGKRGRNAQRFSPGDHVRVPDGPFAGLDGVIVPSRKNGSVRVEFCGGLIEAEIDPWLVQAIGVRNEQLGTGTAAEAA